MTIRLYRTVVAAAAVILASLALSATFKDWSWFPATTGAVLAVAGAGLLARLARVPWWLQPGITLLGLWIYVALTIVKTGPLGGVIPTEESLGALMGRWDDGFGDISDLMAPTSTTAGLIALATIGVGLTAVFVEAIAVGLGRAAVAGIPLLAVYAIPVAVAPERLSPITFAAGAAGYLWLLTADNRERVLGWGRLLRPEGSDQARPSLSLSTPLGSAGRLALVGIVVAALIPAVVPALPGADLGALAAGPGFGAGGSRRVTPPNPIAALRGNLRQPENREIMRVSTGEARPQYLRMVTLDRFTPRGWTLSEIKVTSDNRVSAGIPASADQSATSGAHPVRATITTQGLRDLRFLPIYPNPTKIEVAGDWRLDVVSGNVVTTRDTAEGLRYDLTARQSDFGPDDLRSSPPLSPDDPIQRRYATIPAVPEADRVAERLTTGESTDYDKVMAIRRYFAKPEFQYSLETKPGTSGNDLVDFLRNKSGYCEQYASAMTYLVRSAGVPARVAVGFTKGTKSSNGQWSIRTHDAHAWVEVFFAGRGWVTFDPTPSYAGSNASTFPWANPADNPGSGDDNEPSATPSASGSAGGQLDPSNRPRRDDRLGSSTAATPAGGSRSGPPLWLWWAGGAALLLIAILTPALIRLRLAGSRIDRAGSRPAVNATGGGPRRAWTIADGAHLAWAELLDTLTDLRLPIDAAETPRALAERLTTTIPLDHAGAEAARLLALSEERGRYAAAPTPVAPPAAIAGAVRTLREQLRGSVNRRTRVRARLMPPSALARIRDRLTSRQASLAAGWWRFRARLIPRRESH